MISITMFQEYTAQILDNPSLSYDQQEEKIIQISDLCHFTDFYKPSLKIVDFSHVINVVDDGGQKKGVYFCDHKDKTSYPFNRWKNYQNYLNVLKRQLKIKELWFVIVVENFISENAMLNMEFVDSKTAGDEYDKIFYFNFSQSTIKILK